MCKVPQGRNETPERRNGEPSAACERKELQSFSRGLEWIVYTRAVRKLWLCGLEEQIIHWIPVIKPDLKVRIATSYNINHKTMTSPETTTQNRDCYDMKKFSTTESSLHGAMLNDEETKKRKVKRPGLRTVVCNRRTAHTVIVGQLARPFLNYSSHERKPHSDWAALNPSLITTTAMYGDLLLSNWQHPQK